jgi:hypothetical protein
MLSAYLAIHAAILFGASDSKPIADAQLVGTWESSAKNTFNIHGTPTMTYRADHTCTHKGYDNEGVTVAQGTWRLHGRKLVTRFGKDLVMEQIVLSVTADQFKTRAEDGTIFTHTRVKSER